MKTKSFKSSLLLFLAAFIWGVAFVAQSVGMDYVGPFTFNAVRCFVGSFILIPVIFWNQKRTAKELDKDTLHDRPKESILGGISCGILFFIATSLQQIGILYTSVGKAGFITALYIVIVPILGIFLKRKVNLKIWISVLIALVGLYLLCMSGSLTLTKGDALILLSALFFSFHILVVDHFSSKVSGVKLSCIQLFIASVCSLGTDFIRRNPFLRCCLYPTDYRPEKFKSNHCLFNFKSGICHLCPCRMGDFTSDFKHTGVDWLCPYVRCDSVS